jgi:hypothetical protein
MIQSNDKIYFRIHDWLKRKYGRASKCENDLCQSKNPKRFEWALLKGMDHDFNRDNYIMLCPSCHRKYDYTEEQKRNLSYAKKVSYAKNGFSKNHLENLSAAMKGIGNVGVIKLSKSWLFIQEYESVSVAAKENGILQSSLSNVLTGRSKTAGGYIWQYKRKS